jgi:hypothetical protein
VATVPTAVAYRTGRRVRKRTVLHVPSVQVRVAVSIYQSSVQFGCIENQKDHLAASG